MLRWRGHVSRKDENNAMGSRSRGWPSNTCINVVEEDRRFRGSVREDANDEYMVMGFTRLAVVFAEKMDLKRLSMSLSMLDQ